MAALDDLQPDRRAVLQLLVARGRGYDQIAELLDLPEIVVRRRAHDALTTLAGGPGGLLTEPRALLCDYLVGELPASRRAEARRLLADDPAARRFARTAAARLSALPGAQLPELPPEDEEVADALDALDARRERKAELAHSSHRGGWLIVGAIAAVVVAAVIALSILAGGSNDDGSPKASTSDTTPATTDRTTYAAQLTSPSGGGAKGEVALRPNTDGATVLALNATGLAPSLRLSGDRIAVYAVWLSGPEVDPLFIGFTKAVEDDGALQQGGLLNGVKDSPAVDASDLQKYHTLFVTREILPADSKSAPATPGKVALTGTLGIVQ